MEENYTAGELGEVFDKAVPLTLHEVRNILKQISAEDVVGGKLQPCREQVSLLEEVSAAEDVIQELREVRLHRDHERDETNAHLARLLELQPEEEDQLELPMPSSARPLEPLKPFEVVALATLMPKSVEEALVVVPSLSRFVPEELNENVIRILD